MTTPSPYEPPHASLEDGRVAKRHDARTVGYLVGGVLQLAGGVFFTIAKALSHPPGASIFGLALLFLGMRTMIKYQARRRSSRGAALKGR